MLTAYFPALNPADLSGFGLNPRDWRMSRHSGKPQGSNVLTLVHRDERSIQLRVRLKTGDLATRQAPASSIADIELVVLS